LIKVLVNADPHNLHIGSTALEDADRILSSVDCTVECLF
jgi:hypothetical protein